MKNIKSLLVVSLTSLFLVSCNKPCECDQCSPCKPCGDDTEEGYVTKDINVYYEKDVVSKQLPLRFYESTPSVPYISVKEYFKEFYKTETTKTIDGTFLKYATSGGAFLGFDAKNDLFEISDAAGFNYHPDSKEVTGKLFLQCYESIATEPTLKVISLKDYSIDIHREDYEAYAPVSLLGMVTGSTSFYTVSYNGNALYFFDVSGNLADYSRSASYYGDSYYDQLIDFDTPRNVDMVNYTYNELCFVFDNFRGYTSHLIMGDNNLLTLGLDGVLSKYYPSIKTRLLSKDKKEYFKGFYTLFLALYDNGHTAMQVGDTRFTATLSELADDPTYVSLMNEAVGRERNRMYASTFIKETRRTTFPSGVYKLSDKKYYLYDEENKISYIGFDSFTIDLDGWDDYYNGKGDVPVDTDSYAYVRSKFYQAVEDGAINVVLDLATNTGGNSYSLLGIAGLFNQAKADFDANVVTNKYRLTEKFKIDINLDGKFDEADATECDKFTFNLGILTSGVSFSCGNLLPSVLKGYGYKTLGLKSGGGSCAVSYQVTADGFPFVHSSYLCLSNQNGENIDDGVEPDYLIPLVEGDSGYVVDYSSFYNFSDISTYLSGVYVNE